MKDEQMNIGAKVSVGLLALMLTLTGWALYASQCASAKADSVRHDLDVLRATGSLINRRADEKLDEITRRLERIEQKLNTN